MRKSLEHQFVDRATGKICTERLFADKTINFLYSHVRENLPFVFKALTGSRASGALGYLNFDSTLSSKIKKPQNLMRKWEVDADECLDDLESLNTPEKIFTRKIKYWQYRPMDCEVKSIVAPADSRMLLGSFASDSLLFIKDKFFCYEELLGELKSRWLKAFKFGDYAIFRLTPDKYHYVHTPCAGRVLDIYEVEGAFHSCNPSAVVSLVTPFSKNKRVVTIIDTDYKGGANIGLVAMIEVVALMIGAIDQCYSAKYYDDPWPVVPGMFLEKGVPKSLFKPGSSTVLLLFQKDRIQFDGDLVENQSMQAAESRFSKGFGQSLVETEIKVRETLCRTKS